MNNLVLNQHTIPYIHVARTVPIYINFIYMAFCINIVYFTPMAPILYLPNCRLYDGGIKLLNLFLTCLRNGRFWENSEISQNAMALTANVPNRKRNIRNFPFGHT